jgi:hypothetical protein
MTPSRSTNDRYGQGCLSGLALLPLVLVGALLKHRGWDVSGDGAKPVRYPSRARAENVARQVQGGKVSRAGGDGCAVVALVLLSLPVVLAAVAVVSVVAS